MDALNNLLGKMKESPKLTVFAGATILASAGFLAYSFLGSKGDSELLPAVSDEEAREMMDDVLKKIKILIPKMIKAAEGIKQQLAAQGQEIDDQQLMKTFILPHVETAVDDITKSVLADHDMDDDELEEAVQYYCKHGDQKLIDVTKKIKAIYREFGGDSGDAAPTEVSAAAKGMHIDDIVRMMAKLADQMSLESDTYTGQYVRKFGVPQSEQEKAHFQSGLMEVAELAEKTLLSEFGLTAEDFQGVLMANQSNQTIIQIFTAMQYENQRIMSSHGIRP